MMWHFLTFLVLALAFGGCEPALTPLLDTGYGCSTRYKLAIIASYV